MQESSKRNFAPQLVGLGGTGADIIASMLRNKDLMLPLLRTNGIRVSCMGLDVATAQIENLTAAYDEMKLEMKSRNIPGDKLFLVAKSVKFPTPEVMFDFVRDYRKYLSKEGSIEPANYKPWLSSAVDIPPLAGGVGRKRALAKAIYGLNYHVLRMVSDAISSFKEHVVSSTLQPIIFLIYGMGGGSGSGMALDFARHLRKEVGSGVPIIGLAILPCPGDDPPAKGASAYAAVLEHSLVLDRTYNNMVTRKFGAGYENPFNAFFVMPLGPAFGQGKGLLYAHQTIDEAVGDILIRSLNFDPADLLANIGANVDLEGQWMHSMSTVSISYPVQEYIELTQGYLDRLDKITGLRKEKKELYRGAHMTETGGVRKLLDACRAELTDIYKMWLTRRGRYDPEKFPELLRSMIYEDRAVDADYAVYIRGIQDSVKAQMNELYQSVRAIGLAAPEGTLEARIRKLLLQFYDLASEVGTKPSDFEQKVPEIMSSLPEDLLTAHQLTPRQVQLVRDVIDLADIILDYLAALRGYLECRKLADRLYRLVESSEKSEDREKALAAIRKISSPELVVLFSLISSIHTPLTTEIKNMDEYLTNCRRMKKMLSEEERSAETLYHAVEEQRILAEAEKRRLEKDIQSLRPIFSPPGKRKMLMARIGDVKQRLAILDQEIAERKAESDRVAGKVKEYASIEKKFETNSEYRKLVALVIDLTNRYYERQGELRKDRGFYDRTGELTEAEQLKIMQLILKGEQSALSRENVLDQIVDKDHLRRYLVSVLNLFRLPDTLGVTQEYRSDFIWFTVVAPQGIWNKELEHDVTTALSGYVKGDVSRTIYIRQIDSDDPWKVRFMVVAAKATPKWLSSYQDMRQLYFSSSPGEKHMAHSFLIEHGVLLEEDEPESIMKALGQPDAKP
ncbi:MAG: tubulin-like doman-containing protein [Dehalococcoidia bacterium]|nr:tubulin-like doman-containing protein [Dehalococcoidia bacterium]